MGFHDAPLITMREKCLVLLVIAVIIVVAVVVI